MECHGAVFVEPTPEFDLQRTVNWGEIANVILKAAEKEENFSKIPDAKPEAKLHKPFERLKDCVSCCKYLLEDMQLENILDKYNLRQDANVKDKEEREKCQHILDIKNDAKSLRQMKFPCFNLKLSNEQYKKLFENVPMKGKRPKKK